MDKNKILQQLEQKLLPSVENLDKEQASEHDFFPALLWMLLEKIKASETQLQSLGNSNREGFKQTANYIVTKNQSFQNETNQVIDKDIENLYIKMDESLSKTAIQIINQFQTVQNETNQVIDKKFDEMIKAQQIQDINSSKHFKWILGICIFQFITLTALIVFMLVR